MQAAIGHGMVRLVGGVLCGHAQQTPGRRGWQDAMGTAEEEEVPWVYHRVWEAGDA